MMKSQGARQMQTTRTRSTGAKKGTSAKKAAESEGAYLFFVDCVPKYCKEVRKHMEADGFETEVIGRTTLFGDHIAIKKFKSLKAARNSINKLMRDLGTEPTKVKRIMVDPKYDA